MVETTRHITHFESNSVRQKGFENLASPLALLMSHVGHGGFLNISKAVDVCALSTIHIKFRTPNIVTIDGDKEGVL